MRPVLDLLFALVAFVFVVAPIRADEVDTYVAGQLKKQHLPGLSLAVLRNGKIVKAKGYGLASVELNVPATPNTVYHLASVTKQFTAFAIMLLVEEGKVGLSDSITTYLDSVPAAWSNITVRHLLTMTSGIRDYFGHVPNGVWREDFTNERIIGLVADLPLEFPPGDAFRYSNSNYLLLAMIIRKVSAKSYDVFLAERVFGPLGMTSTRRDNPSDVISNRAALYELAENKLVNAPFVSPGLWNNGCGGLLSSVVDLAKWDAALYGRKFLSDSTREAMWTPGKFNNGKTQLYGFGWDVGEQGGHRWVGHSGGRPGTSTQITRFLDDGLTVIVLMNGRGNAFDTALHIAGMYVPGLTLSSIKPRRDPEPELTQRLKQSLFDLAEKRDSEFILPQVREEYAKSNDRIADLQKRLAHVKSFTYVSTEKALASAPDVLHGVTRNCSYKMVSADDTRFYIFELTADNRVARLISVAD